MAVVANLRNKSIHDYDYDDDDDDDDDDSDDGDYASRYYDPSHEAGYAGARNLIRVNASGKPLNSGREKRRVYEWLSNQDAYTLHRPVKRRFPRLRYDVTNIDDVWECDLLQFTSISEYNDQYGYLLVIIDVLSKYAWVEPLRDKTTGQVAKAFEKIIGRADGRVPIYVQSDKGKEFVGSAFQRTLKKHGIRFRVARNPDIKAAVVERLNRTLRERIWRYFTHKATNRWLDVVQKIVSAYNHTRHSGTRMRPCEVTLYNAAEARANLRKRSTQQTSNRNGNRRPPGSTLKYRVGDYVRISRTKNTFEKGYEKNFSEEIFKIKSVTKRQNHLFIYVLEDLDGETIDGFFYTEELTLVGRERLDKNREFRIERVIRTRGKGNGRQALVKWLGYPNKFNSWIKYSELPDKSNAA